MSQQHLVREIQQLKHEVALLKEGGLGPGVRDQGVDIDDLLEWVKGLEERVDKIEAALKPEKAEPDVFDEMDPWEKNPKLKGIADHGPYAIDDL
tara:strand:- start:38 stop:319 length:282 start_codon:yes stop_codon:yes gene_type:complete